MVEPSTELAPVPELTPTRVFTTDEIDLIKKSICKGASDLELRMFLALAARSGLDPFSRQIYSIERREKDRDGNWRTVRQTQTSIDGLRLIAQRTGEYEGQTPPEWCARQGTNAWRDVWNLESTPVAARIGVWRKGFREPCVGVAHFDEYAQRDRSGNLTAMWQRMGVTMIAKCAEALALRKAFAQEMSGLYTADEMAQAIPADEAGDVVTDGAITVQGRAGPPIERDENPAPPAGDNPTAFSGDDPREQVDPETGEITTAQIRADVYQTAAAPAAPQATGRADITREKISAEQAVELRELIVASKTSPTTFLGKAAVQKIDDLPLIKFEPAKKWLQARLPNPPSRIT
jgi:phage recombination protein Bet